MPAYDAAGNMIRAPRPGQESSAGEALFTVYDAWNRPAKVYKDSNQNGTLDVGTDALIAEYRYDGRGWRIAKLIPNGNNWDRTDYYYNESWQCLEERYGANQSKETLPTSAKIQWLWSVQYIDAPVVRWRDGNCDGDLTGGTQEGDNTLYYTNDANMNVTALVDASDGAVVERYSYDPYGQPTVRHGVRDAAGNDTSANEWSARTSNTFDNDVLYCGYRWDWESGLYDPRGRYYHPTFGRMTTRDGGYWDGMNRYEYGPSSPANGVDPSGLTVESTIMLGHGFTRSVGGAGGTMTWTRILLDPKGDTVGMYFKFFPSKKGCCCETIGFLQAVRNIILGKPFSPRPQFMTKEGWQLDTLPEWHTPYTNVDVNEKVTGWKDRGGTS